MLISQPSLSLSLSLGKKHVDDVRANAISQFGQLGKISFKEVDVVQGLPPGKDGFDVIYSGQTSFRLLSGDKGIAQATEVMRRIHRVLKPGGVVATRDVSCVSLVSELTYGGAA